MATKRMFSKQIIDSDAFLDMPTSSQVLYFHLVMRADDEGFIGNPKKIIRMIGVGNDDFKILIAKRFVLTFNSGVIVIKHWLVHNIIRMDRFNKTAYNDEKKLLVLKENRSYTEIKNSDKTTILLNIEKVKPEWLKNREKVMKESTLPYSFTYKIRNAFSGKKCPICGVEMREQEISKNCKPTIQHNIPLSNGGKHELGNISVICSNCNVSIQDKETDGLNSLEVIKVWKTIGNQSATQAKLSKVKLSKVKLSNTDSDVSNFFKIRNNKNFEDKYPLEEEKKEFFLKAEMIYLGNPSAFLKGIEMNRWQAEELVADKTFLLTKQDVILKAFQDKKIKKLPAYIWKVYQEFSDGR